MKKRRRRKNPGGFWPWATEHWFIAGFFILPAVISMPVMLVQALRSKDGKTDDSPRSLGTSDVVVSDVVTSAVVP